MQAFKLTEGQGGDEQNHDWNWLHDDCFWDENG